ncbi:MAG: hypothetical protein R3282_05495 [Rhodothermales bacterium]|nr:hypothetical protein [Rhodothermales bacterium]
MKYLCLVYSEEEKLHSLPDLDVTLRSSRGHSRAGAMSDPGQIELLGASDDSRSNFDFLLAEWRGLKRRLRALRRRGS